MIVRITVTRMLGPCVAPGCGGSGLPPVGISPAKIGADRAHMSTSAIANRFMGVGRSFEVEKDAEIST